MITLCGFLILSPFGHWLIRLLGLSAFLYGIGYGVLEYARRKGTDVFWTRKQKFVSLGISTARKASILILGAAIGYGIRDHQLASRLVNYQDVAVVQKFSDDHFLIQPARMVPLDSELCSDSIPNDLKQGDTLEYFRFEQRDRCKRLIAYGRKAQGELNASIQMR